MSWTETEWAGNWHDLGQHSLLLELNLRCLCKKVKREKRLRDHSILVAKVRGALAQASNFGERLRDLGYDFGGAKNVWCSLASDYLRGVACCEILLRDPEDLDEEELAFRSFETGRLQGGEGDTPEQQQQQQFPLCASDTSWFDAVKSYELLDENIDILLEKCEGEEDYDSTLKSAMSASFGMAHYLDEVRREARTSEEQLECDREAWRYLVARHLADTATVASVRGRYV